MMKLRCRHLGTRRVTTESRIQVPVCCFWVCPALLCDYSLSTLSPRPAQQCANVVYISIFLYLAVSLTRRVPHPHIQSQHWEIWEEKRCQANLCKSRLLGAHRCSAWDFLWLKAAWPRAKGLAENLCPHLGQWFPNLNMPQNHLEGLLKHRFLGLTSRISDSVSLEWDLRVCLSNKFLGQADAAGRGTPVWEPLAFGSGS